METASETQGVLFSGDPLTTEHYSEADQQILRSACRGSSQRAFVEELIAKGSVRLRFYNTFGDKEEVSAEHYLGSIRRPKRTWSPRAIPPVTGAYGDARMSFRSMEGLRLRLKEYGFHKRWLDKPYSSAVYFSRSSRG